MGFHAPDVVRQLDQRALEGNDLAIDARARDRQLACLVHEAVDQVGVDAQQRLALAALEHHILAHRLCRRGHHGDSARLVFLLLENIGSRDIEERAHVLAPLQMIERAGKAVEVVVDVIESRCSGHRLGIHGDDLGLEHVRQFAQPHETGHACASLQGMQMADKLGHRRVVCGTRFPCAQCVAHLRNDFLGLVEENRQEIIVDVVLDATFFLAGFEVFLEPRRPVHLAAATWQVAERLPPQEQPHLRQWLQPARTPERVGVRTL